MSDSSLQNDSFIESRNYSEDSDFQENTHIQSKKGNNYNQKKRDAKFLGKRIQSKNLNYFNFLGIRENEDEGLNDESKEIIKTITKDYNLTYKFIRKNAALKRKPLADYDIDEIKDHIKIMRYKLGKRSLLQKSSKDNSDELIEFLTKLYPNNSIKNQQEEIQDLQNKPKIIQDPLEEQKLALMSKYILENFGKFDNQQKVIIHKAFMEKLKDDQNFNQLCCQIHLQENKNKIIELFGTRNINQIQQLIKDFPKEQIIDIHFQAVIKFEDLQQEGQTLFMTLYPYLIGKISYQIIDQSQKEIFKNMLLTINMHIQDNKLIYNPSFIGLLIEYQPHLARKIFIKNYQSNQVKEYAIVKGFSEDESIIISSQPQKFIWPAFFDKLFEINILYRTDMIIFLSKVQVISDPNALINDFLSLFSQRRMLLTIMCKRPSIQLPLERCFLVIQQLRELELEQIEQILQLDENMWLREITKIQSISMYGVPNQKNKEIFQNIYEDKLKLHNVKDRISVEQMTEISLKLETVCDEYKHNDYQTIVSAIILSMPQNFIQVHLPTASGKTWIIAQISEYWRQRNKKVMIIVPNEILKIQSERQFQSLGFNIQFETIENFYMTKHLYDILIVDEYDNVAFSNPFKAFQGKIYGIWDFTLTQCYLFSATCEIGVQNILQSLLGQPAVLQFKSEIELISGIQQDQGGEIIICKNEEERIKAVFSQIQQLAKHIPLIIFADLQMHKQYESKIKEIGLENLKIGITIDTLDEIQSWNSGILLLNPNQNFGNNTKFRQDAKVIISSNVNSESQYLQMRGRSSRTRGNLQSVYFVVSNLNKAQILTGMKKLSFNQMKELSKLLDLVFKKRNNKFLIETISECQNQDDQIHSLQELKQIIGPAEFDKLMKGFK